MELEDLNLNESGFDCVDDLLCDVDDAGIEAHEIGGADVFDCGIKAPGGLAAGLGMAQACLAGLAEITLSVERLGDWPCGKVTVEVEEPLVPCLLSQYAGWKVALKDYFAMASGPMRAIWAGEPLFEELDYQEDSEVAIGVLETRQLPTEAVVEHFCEELGIDAEQLTLLVAPTASIAGSYQIVARSVETCLHKLYELDFDVRRIRAGVGSAFLPPVPKDDLAAIGRTNDSILYGSEVLLWLDGDDESIAEFGPQVPASASRDYGVPFATIFQRHGGDFYQIDPLLFSPAIVVFNNISTGSVFRFGKTDHDLLAHSFFGS